MPGGRWLHGEESLRDTAPRILGQRLRSEARDLYDDTVLRIGESCWLRMSHAARWAELCVEFRDLVCEHTPDEHSGTYLRDLSSVLRRLFELRDSPVPEPANVHDEELALEFGPPKVANSGR